MQLELSNLQRVVADQAVDEEVRDLSGAEQLSAPIIEKMISGLVRSYDQSE
jgi:hypothetical protein